jgi:hypothetical protein
LLLEGKVPPPNDPENLGTRDYSKLAVAIVTGAVCLHSLILLKWNPVLLGELPLNAKATLSMFVVLNLYFVRDTMTRQLHVYGKHVVGREYG